MRRVLERLGIDETSCRHIVLVGGSVLDFELSNILTEEMAKNKITAGKGNIRGSEGPRNASSHRSYHCLGRKERIIMMETQTTGNTDRLC